MSNKFRGTSYSQCTIQGGDSSLWKWASMTDALAAFLNDASQSAADKKYAAEILRWGLEREKSSSDPEVARFLNQLDLSMLWENPQHFALQDVTTEGKTTRQCVCTQSGLTPVAATTAKVATPVEVDDSDTI